LQDGSSDILAKLQENKQEFYNKIEDLAANLTELNDQRLEQLETLLDNKQEVFDRVKEIAVNLTKLREQNLKLLNKLQDDKQTFDDKIKEIIIQQYSGDKINITIPLEGNSEFIVKLKQVKQKLDNKINQLKIEAQEKIQQLKDNLEIQEQDGVSKRDLFDPLAGDSVISTLLSVPTFLVSAFQKKFSEFKEEADQILNKFVSFLDGSFETLGNLQIVVNGSVVANVTNLSDAASAASSCFEAQEATVESLVKETGE
jgi:hypothetical protein